MCSVCERVGESEKVSLRGCRESSRQQRQSVLGERGRVCLFEKVVESVCRVFGSVCWCCLRSCVLEGWRSEEVEVGESEVGEEVECLFWRII